MARILRQIFPLYRRIYNYLTIEISQWFTVAEKPYMQHITVTEEISVYGGPKDGSEFRSAHGTPAVREHVSNGDALTCLDLMATGMSLVGATGNIPRWWTEVWNLPGPWENRFLHEVFTPGQLHTGSTPIFSLMLKNEFYSISFCVWSVRKQDDEKTGDMF